MKEVVYGGYREGGVVSLHLFEGGAEEEELMLLVLMVRLRGEMEEAGQEVGGHGAGRIQPKVGV